MGKMIDATAVYALAKVKGRAHVVEAVERSVNNLANQHMIEAIDTFLVEASNPRLETWFHIAVLTATFELRMFLEKRDSLFKVAFDRIAGEQDVITAEKTLTGLL
jgi:hypothetical protein